MSSSLESTAGVNNSNQCESADMTAVSSTIRELLIGLCLGVANIIPGVSGGTFLLVFGIYERVFSILNLINKDFLVQLAGLGMPVIKTCGRKGTASDLVAFFRDTGFLFLFKLGIGAVVAILALSSLMKYLLLHHFSVTYALFLGLILVSVIIPVRMIKSFKAGTLFFIILGMGLTIFVTVMVNPYDKIKVKSDYLSALYGANETAGSVSGAPAKPFTFTGRYSVDEYLYIGMCGALAISATVLPGISGSLVMILMGSYFDVISAISALKTLNLDTFAFLGVFALGVLLGGLMFARLVSFVLERYYNATMGFLIGLMIGSLYALWPFKKTIVMARQYVKQDGLIRVLENVPVQTNINMLPGSEDPLSTALVFFVLGGIIMMGFVRAESGKSG